MKKDLLQSLKIIIFGIIISVGFSYVLAWTPAPSNPPSSNISTPINISNTGQVKGGTNNFGSLLHINGTLSSNSLGIFGNATVAGSLNIASLGGSGTTNICADNDGILIHCPLTSTLPIVLSTDPASLVNTTTATSGGNVISLGDSTAASAKGVVWIAGTATPALPSTNKTVNGSGLGSFVSNITGLSSGTTYGVRAYATNPLGITYYGDKISFTTPTVPITAPTVATTNVTGVTGTTASSGGTVSGGSGTTVTEKGLMLSIGTTNVFNKVVPSGGVGTGTLVTNLTGLSINTSYKVKAYAETNNFGTYYGTVQSFTTTGGATCGGVLSNNYCWYLGNAGQSCTTVCGGSRGGCNPTTWQDPATVSNTIKAQVFQTFGISGGMGFTGFTGITPAHWIYGGTYGTSYLPYSCGASASEYKRLCACIN